MKHRRKQRWRRIARQAALLPMPTRLGWYFLGAFALMFSAGSYYRENAFVLLACLPLALLLVNALLVWWNLQPIAVKRRLPPECHAGDSVEIALLIHNKGKLPRFVLEVDDDPLPTMHRPEDAVLAPAVSGGFVYTGHYSAAFSRRGRQRLKQCTVSTAFPFGLTRMTRRMKVPGETLVYPRPARLAESFERRMLDAARYFGESAAASVGQDEVYGVREYLPGHNVARIHWRTTARTGKPMVLELEGRHDASFTLLLDTAAAGRPQLLNQRLEAAVSMCAGICYFLTMHKMLFRFGWCNGAPQVSRPDRGDRHYHSVMRALATADVSERHLSEWIQDVGAGGPGDVPILVTLGPVEHGEAILGGASNAIVVSVSDLDFRTLLRIDPLGRRSVSGQELMTARLIPMDDPECE